MNPEIAFKILEKIDEIKYNAEQVAREIYYALSLIPSGHPAEANLKLALKYLGANKPKDVGLSNSVLEKRK